MGKGFYTGKDSELYISSNVFATQILATPTAFGLTSLQATSYGTLNTAWRTAYEIANTPETRTKSTIAAKDTIRGQLRTMASNLAKIVEGTPTVTNQQKIDLGLSVRATPAPMPPLGQSRDFAVTIDPATGALNLKWKNTNPQGATGVVYQIWRQIGVTGEPEYMGGVGEKKFTDSTLPPGTAQVQYQIQAVRSTSVGPFAQCAIKFGAGASGGTMTASVEEITPAKKAA